MTEHEDQDAREDEQPRDDEQQQARVDRPAGRALAGFALLVALMAAAAAGWAGWQTWQARQGAGGAGERLAAMTGRLDRLDGELDSLQTGMTAARDQASAANDEAGSAMRAAESATEEARALGQSVSDLADEVATLQRALTEQERRLEALASRVDERGERTPGLGLALAQAESLVQAAYGMVELERDPERAVRALSLAAERLRGLQAPGLTRAREAVASELEALRGAPRVDREQLAARLAGLADGIPDLPLRGDMGPAAVAPPEPDGRPETPTEDRGWWQATRDFMGEYFTVRRTDETGTSLPAPGTLTLMRDVLRLALEQARLALLRGEPGLYRQSLERADGLLASYFAGEDPGVTSARDTIAELRDADIDPPLPEVGGALEALRAVNPDSAESP